MHAPTLNRSGCHFTLPGQPTATLSFEVQQDGRVGERTFHAGEHLLLGVGAEDGDAVVLVAKGPGRPRLGYVRGTGLVGDRGEPCSRSRWAVAGRVVGVARPLGADWRVEPFDAPAVMRLHLVAANSPDRSVRRAVQQLSLFAA